jgi:hypothetical protein
VPAFSCTDQVANGQETDVDCGGKDCPGCDVGGKCTLPADCKSGRCESGTCAAGPECTDGAKNGTETDVDCGGKDCEQCPVNKNCKVHADCMSESCAYGICVLPTCSDNVRNQGESDTDCAGPCAACTDGKLCGKPADCKSGACEAGICISCEDKVRNGTETDVDCGGGTCGKCTDGKACAKAADCAGGGCEGGTCCAINACKVCGPLPKEVCNGKDDDCDGATDESWGDGGLCPMQKGVCKGAENACVSGKWVCDASVYQAHSKSWEATETSCDSKDNDCDGQTDEGLLNECGGCGTVPVELCNGKDDDCDGQTDEGLLNACGECGPDLPEMCNGRDDDCDGQTDEADACKTCVAQPAPVEVSTLAGEPGKTYSWEPSVAMAASGTLAWVAYRKIDTNWVVGLIDGKAKSDKVLLGTAGGGIPSVGRRDSGVVGTGVDKSTVSGSKTLIAQVAGPDGVGGAKVNVWNAMFTTATLETSTVVTGDEVTVLAKTGSADWNAFRFAIGDTGAKSYAYLAIPSSSRPHLRSVPNGRIFVFYTNLSGGIYGEYEADWSMAEVTPAGAIGTLQVAPKSPEAFFQAKRNGTFAGVYRVEDSVWEAEGTAQMPWNLGVIVAAGTNPALGLNPGDEPVVVGVRDGKTLWEARRDETGAWKTRDLHTTGVKEYLVKVSVAVDDAGRAHVVAQVRTDSTYSSTFRLLYWMSCWNGK